MKNLFSLLVVICSLVFAACSGSDSVETCSICPNIDAGGIAQEGSSCTTAKDCACKFDCIANVCVAYKKAFAGCQCATDACDPAITTGTDGASVANEERCNKIMENTLVQCSDGVDNDCNGYVDCYDFSCSESPEQSILDYCKTQ